MGDSIMEAIGATHPEDGIAGRIAEYLSTPTKQICASTGAVGYIDSDSRFHKLSHCDGEYLRSVRLRELE